MSLADLRFRFWCLLLDVANWADVRTHRVYLWMVKKAADADYARWGYDNDPDLSEANDGDTPF